MRDRIFKCIWCGHVRGESQKNCNAPDGDGHLYEMKMDFYEKDEVNVGKSVGVENE